LGYNVEGLMTAEEALAKAGLDWTVEKRPALTFAGDGSTVITVPNQWAAVRTTDDHPLGITGDVHTLVQNVDAFAWGDSIVADQGAHWERAGSFRDGRIVFMALELPEHIMLPGEDEIVPYLLISNGHDGKRSLEAAFTGMRVACINTLTYALKNAARKITLRHATNIDERMAVAAETLGVTYKYMDSLRETATRLATKKITNAQGEAILREVFPVSESFDTPDRIDMTDFAKALAIWKNADNLESIRKTGWGVVQAVGEYIDHEVEYRARRWSPEDTRFRSLVIGGVAMSKKDKALNAALALL
jgi:phage/plasmid-like protein (TIGR03299 family)